MTGCKPGPQVAALDLDRALELQIWKIAAVAGGVTSQAAALNLILPPSFRNLPQSRSVSTLESHTVEFRGSENFAEWRGLVGQYFAAPPEVEHTQTVLNSAG